MDLGELKVVFGADSSQLLRASQNVKSALGSVSSSMKRATVTTAKYAGALTGLGIAISTVMVKKQLQAADALAKTSDALGIQTERLQALQHLGELTGSTTEEVNKTLTRMERRLGEVARLGGTAAFAFKDIGINIDEVIKLSPDKQFEALSAALVGVENQSIKASIAQDIFGRSGLKALRLMEQLKDEGLEPAVQELEALGFSLNRVEAAKIEAANDAMLRFNKGIQGVFQSLTIQLAPILEGVSNKLVEMIKNAGGAEQVMISFVDTAVSAFGGILDVIHLVSKAIRGLADGIAFVFKGVKGLLSLVADVSNIRVTPAGQKLADKISDSLFGDLPSAKIKKFVAEVRASSEEAAKQVEESVKNKVLDGDFKSSFFQDQEQKKLSRGGGNNEAELERFRESLMSEEELERLSFEKRLQQLNQFIENKQLTEQEAAAARTTLEQQHQDELTRIESDAFRQRMQLVSSTLQTQVGNVASSLKLITGVAGKEGKKQFEITKAASIATALIKGTESIVSSYAAGAKIGGPVLAAAFAATAAGAVGAQIAQIKSQQYNGGSSGGAGVATTSGGGTVAGGQAQEVQRQRGVNIQGLNPNDLFTGQQIKDLIEKINEEVEDGAVLISTGAAA